MIPHLGFPDYFRIELGAGKLLGAIALILPFVPRKVKEFAYAGFTIIFVSAFIAHLASGDTCGDSFSLFGGFLFVLPEAE
jgi:hypothetical protein